MQCGEKASIVYLNPDKGSIFEFNVSKPADFFIPDSIIKINSMNWKKLFG